MKHRVRKSHIKQYILLCVCALIPAVSFLLPWVSIPHDYAGLKLPTVSYTAHQKVENRLIFFSINNICRLGLSHKALKMVRGYQVPSQVRALSTLPIGFDKNIRYYIVLLYAYPFILAILLYMQYAWHVTVLSRAVSIAVCSVVMYLQIIKMGFTDVSRYPVVWYCDYGYWLGCAGFFLFALTVAAGSKK